MAKDILPGGLADNKPDSDFDQKTLKEGIKVEMEHTSDPDIAKEISKDHITENPGYYPALKVMERKLEGRKFKKSALVKGVKQRDLRAAQALAGYHLAPFTEHGDSQAGIRSANKELRQLFNSSARKDVVLDTVHAHKYLNPVSHGRAISPKHAANPIVIGRLKDGHHVLLDGNHRLIHAKENGIPTIKATIFELPDNFSDLVGMDSGVGKIPKKAFKKSSLLQKGSMRRLAPWTKESRQATANLQEDLGDWQENANRTSRKNLTHQKIDDSSRKRTLHKLSGMTPTKVHPDGKRSFLLHRGMDIGEYQRAKTKGPKGPAFQHHEESSWTPNLTISGGFASDAGRDLRIPEGAHVSAWIHEDQIALMPNQHSQNTESDQYKYEQEVIVKPRGVSPLVRRDEVTKLTGVDKDDKYSHPGGKVLDNPDRMINFRQQNQKQFGGDPIARNKYILPEFKRNRFKKSQLQKGVKQRLFPVKGGRADTPNPKATSYSMDSWQTHEDNIGRKQLAYDLEVQLSPQAKARALHSLHGKTVVRRNKYGEREFLLHRGMGSAEKELALDIPSRQTMHNAPTSWTPNVATASWFERGGDGAIVSAWIPESAIKHIPTQLGHPTKEGKNPYAREHEVIVHPGNYHLVHDKEVKRLIGQGKRDRGPGVYSLDQAINFRDRHPDVSGKDITETYAKERRNFKKSQLLAKAPIIHEQNSDFTYRTLDDNAFNEHFHEMVHEESLPNGLIHHIYQEKNSPDGIIHSLSEGDPSQPVSLIAGYIEHKGPYKGYNAHLTATAPEHQGQGHGTLLKELATKRHGRMVSDATLSPAEDRSWQKLKRPDIDVQYGPNIGGNEEVSPEVAAEAVEKPHIATYKKPLAASEFKKSSLIKGAARRLYGKFNPNKLPGRDQVGEWQTSVGFIQDLDSDYDEDLHREARESIPKMDPAQKLRALNKLSAQTLTRKHPETGERQFLLFRGIGPDEAHTVGDHHIENDQRSSWTPKKAMADVFSSEKDHDDARTIGAWINESDIHAAPHMYGKLPDLKQDFENAGQLYVPNKPVKGKNTYTNEHEIIVGPHKSMRATKGDAKRHFAINEFHSPQDIASTKDVNARIQGRAERAKMGVKPSVDLQLRAEKRRKFQKSSIFSK